MAWLRCAAFAFGMLLSSLSAFAQQPNYWFVAGDTSKVWSLEANNTVGLGDPNYAAWLARGFAPQKIASTSELYDVIAASYPAHLAASAPNLEILGGGPGIGLTPAQSYAYRRAAGLNITYSGRPDLSGRYPTDDLYLSGLITGALLCTSSIAPAGCSPLPLGLGTVAYLDLDQHPHNLAVGELGIIGLAIRDYVANMQMAVMGTASWPPATKTVP